ncbi:MAG: hypothetical protein AAF492_28965, partial [Verrucomicrobiota bacterium]
DPIQQVELLRDGDVVHTFDPTRSTRRDGDRIPVTDPFGLYGEGWLWHPSREQSLHLQADWPIKKTGWYTVRINTKARRLIQSDTMHFDGKKTVSHSLSIAHLSDPDTALTLWGYGEDGPLEELHPSGQSGSWWYPRNIYWRLSTDFGPGPQSLGWPPEQPELRFKKSF